MEPHAAGRLEDNAGRIPRGPCEATKTVAFTTYLVGFNDMRMSYASALAYLIVGGVLVLTLVFMGIQRYREARPA